VSARSDRACTARDSGRPTQASALSVPGTNQRFQPSIAISFHEQVAGSKPIVTVEVSEHPSGAEADAGSLPPVPVMTGAPIGAAR
jgi:hypothetical protein